MRNTYIIIPLKTTRDFDINEYSIPGAEDLGFDSDSLSDLIRHKCRDGQGFVKRFRLECAGLKATIINKETHKKSDLKVSDLQMVVFENGIGFLIPLFCVPETDHHLIYDFVNPGYLEDMDKDSQQLFIDELREKCLQNTGFDIYVEGEEKSLAIKESYLLNAAFTDRRYKKTEKLDQATFNVHKLIGVEDDIEDKGETDIVYTYGGRDVENRTYRWGCCISKQSISFVYGPSNNNYDTKSKKSIRPVSKMEGKEKLEYMLATAQDDLLLTVLALYQRYTCMMLSEAIVNRMRESKRQSRAIRRIKEEVFRFRAYDTITPSQISRWNNVCETYRHLLEMNGVDEALDDVSSKIDLINEEMERVNASHQNFFTTVIAVFGLTSIVAAVLQIVDYVEPGDPTMLLWTGISGAGILITLIAWIIMMWRNRK